MKLKQIADISLPTPLAHFRMMGFESFNDAPETKSKDSQTALALVLGDIRFGAPAVRIHSQCTTGDIFHSLRCDCHDQLHLALHVIAEEGKGVLLYEYQEGRGIGLMEKLRAYALQEQGFDTLEANLHLGHAVDLRDYRLPVEILRFLNVSSLRLMTNNPRKIQAVSSAGIEIVERLSAEVPNNPYSEHYISTKREKLGHLTGKISPEATKHTVHISQINQKTTTGVNLG